MNEPKLKNLYWGYVVRIAANLSQAINDSIYQVMTTLHITTYISLN